MVFLHIYISAGGLTVVLLKSDIDRIYGRQLRLLGALFSLDAIFKLLVAARRSLFGSVYTRCPSGVSLTTMSHRVARMPT